MSGNYICNGAFFQEQEVSLHPDNRSFRYGDGLFETIRYANGHMPLWDLHMARLFNGFLALKIHTGKLLTPELLLKQVTSLCQRNNLKNARIRITVSRGEGGILEQTAPTPDYIIQTWPLDEPTPRFNTNGLHLRVYPDARKSADALASLKSTNYLLYAMAALYAKEQKSNDAIVLNHYGRIADCSIANVYWVEGQQIFTTPLSEGPVAGVMQQHLCSKSNCKERAITPDELRQASEVFVTNAVRGIQWVGEIDGTSIPECRISRDIYHDIILPLFAAPQTK
ncbi:MAG: aminotransferase class IV [Sphingobacteriales bacterium]